MNPDAGVIAALHLRTAQASTRWPSPFPDGWFRVAASTDVPAGAVRPLRYFGRDLVAFRGRGDRRVRVLDADRPHLGAHLGHGGCVEGDGVRRPFHGWRIGGDRHCLEIPGADRIPPRASVRAWPVREVDGLVFVHHQAREERPTWEIHRADPPLTERDGPILKYRRWAAQFYSGVDVG